MEFGGLYSAGWSEAQEEPLRITGGSTEETSWQGPVTQVWAGFRGQARHPEPSNSEWESLPLAGWKEQQREASYQNPEIASTVEKGPCGWSHRCSCCWSHDQKKRKRRKAASPLLWPSSLLPLWPGPSPSRGQWRGTLGDADPFRGMFRFPMSWQLGCWLPSAAQQKAVVSQGHGIARSPEEVESEEGQSSNGLKEARWTSHQFREPKWKVLEFIEPSTPNPCFKDGKRAAPRE